jgi:hypothetical protein
MKTGFKVVKFLAFDINLYFEVDLGELHVLPFLNIGRGVINTETPEHYITFNRYFIETGAFFFKITLQRKGKVYDSRKIL